jgi:hypothetical protein
MADDELTKLREEWRNRLSLDIDTLKSTCVRIQDDVHGIREGFARTDAVHHLDKRVRDLEDYRARIFGMFIAAQFLGGTIVGIIAYLLKK